ncbi:MAG TPA: aspartate kinase [Edaphocola sp.]|nr:aspartate kinase [Edaphocola sp.]
MQIYKFGGASIATPDRMKALMPILQSASKPLIMVVSALGKTTNALEKVVEGANIQDFENTEKQIKDLEIQHFEYSKSLGLSDEDYKPLHDKLKSVFDEMRLIVQKDNLMQFDYLYDQIVCQGELLSTLILDAYLKSEGLKSQWLDARQLICTNAIYRDAQVEEQASEKAVQAAVLPLLDHKEVIVTQGFIGKTKEGNSTTLGREGSDYTAALLGGFLNANGVSIWKDVEGLLNADPRLFPDAVRISEISFNEVIEMAYYGAQVIHPKTIKPLHNKNIPLYVKCFLDKDLPGTIIKNKVKAIYPPIIVLKPNQALIQVISKDYSFVTEDVLSDIYEIFAKHHVKINIMQNAAISMVAAVDNRKDKIFPLIEDLSKNYEVRRNEGATLLTIRHYDENTIEKLTKDKKVLLTQKTRRTIQLIVK